MPRFQALLVSALIGSWSVWPAVAQAQAAPATPNQPSLSLPRTAPAPPNQNPLAGSNEVNAWERLGSNGEVVEAGVIVPLALIQSPPPFPGPGPAGSMEVVDFPVHTRQTTYLNHFEMHWNPQGHPPPPFLVPHFDFHFYSVPPQQVRQIKTLEASPPASRMPPGFVAPGKDAFVPEMGEHALQPKDLQGPFSVVMVAGLAGGRMHFIEPMATQKFLLQRQSFSLPVPRPADLGRATRFPTTFTATYDPAIDAYRMSFGNFVNVQTPTAQAPCIQRG